MPTLLSTTAWAQSGDSEAGRTREYFHQQDPGVALLVRLDGYESEFQSQIYGPDEQLLMVSEVPGLRMGPVVQFIEPVSKARQLELELQMGRGTSQSRVDLQLIRFDPDGPDSSVITKAYRMMSYGLQREKKMLADTWTMKVVSLKQAANIFDFLGMQELQLWCEFYASHFLLTVLNDALTAAEEARDIRAAATRSNFKTLALSAIQLEGAAMMAQAIRAPAANSGPMFERAQSLFDQAAKAAVELELPYERARAIYQSGLANEAAGQGSTAYTRFESALDVATIAGDRELANEIRKHMAGWLESRGEDAAALALMQQINPGASVPAALAEADTADEGQEPEVVRANKEMASYLFEQGRLQEKTFHHLEAVATLRQALSLNQRAPSATLSGPIRLLLGKALYGAGQFDEALQQLEEGIEISPASRYRTQLEEALGLVATMQRYRNDFASMKSARDAQGTLIGDRPGRADFVYEQAQDALARDGSTSAEARGLLNESRQLARAAGNASIERLTILQICALSAQSCSADEAGQAFATMKVSSIPADMLEARWLWVQMLQRTGQNGSARSELARLVTDMRFFQAYLPGVLGAWYWHNREPVFDQFMAQTLAGADRQAAEALATLAWLSGIDRSQQIDPLDEGDILRLRSLFADRTEKLSGAQVERIDGESQQLLAKLGGKASTNDPGLETRTRKLQEQLRQMDSDSVFLSYYFAEDVAYIWVGGQDGLSLARMPWTQTRSAALSRSFEGMRWDAANGQLASFSDMMDQLGKSLLAPIALYLKPRIFFLGIGRMEGVPFDALRWNGEYLAEQHQVLNLLGLDSPQWQNPSITADRQSDIFLAGNQLTDAGSFAVIKPSSEEIRSVADLFIGPGLHMVQGSALKWDEFQTEHFVDAGLLHLAMPCVIDLRTPNQSRLLLSDNNDELDQGFLLPADIAQQSYQADLVVLSACDFTGSSTTAIDINTRFPPEFLRAGAQSVIASLWSVGDRQAAAFWQIFYNRLTIDQDISKALYYTKRTYLENHQTSEAASWAAFQLFLD